MEPLTPPHSVHVSPCSKRKWDTSDSSLDIAPSPLRLRTSDLPSRPFVESDPAAEGSPQATVAGHFQNLDLEDQDLPKLGFDKNPQPNPRMENSAFSKESFSPHIFLPDHRYNAPTTPPSSSHGPDKAETQVALQTDDIRPLEIPETPNIPTFPTPTPPPSNPAPKAPKSPPPPAPALWWTDTEITGHSPSDPTDDGYGINGVGFLPTPAIANARAERRKRQVKEWKDREAREARQKRSDRRRRRDLEAGARVDVGHAEGGAADGRKVRFLEV